MFCGYVGSQTEEVQTTFGDVPIFTLSIWNLSILTHQLHWIESNYSRSAHLLLNSIMKALNALLAFLYALR